MNRAIVFFVFLLSMCAFAHALSIETGKGAYSKGETIEISGECGAGEPIILSASSDQKLVFEERLSCSSAGNFSAPHEISYLDPAGGWRITANAPSGESTKIIAVESTKPSQYFLISFLSPSRATYHRTDDLAISVRITDAGQAVEDANVVMWGADGMRLALEPQGGGTYSLNYAVPFDAPVGVWKLTVAAERFSGTGRSGGENIIKVNLKESPIKIGIRRPVVRNFDAGETVFVEVELSYLNGKPLRDASVHVRVRDENYAMGWREENIYDFNYALSERDVGSLVFLVEASDAAGNKGVEKIDVIVTAALWRIAGAILIVAAAGFVILVIIAAVFFSMAGKAAHTASLKRTEKNLEEAITKLQGDYFDRTAVDKKTYRGRLSEYEAKLKEAREKLRHR